MQGVLNCHMGANRTSSGHELKANWPVFVFLRQAGFRPATRLDKLDLHPLSLVRADTCPCHYAKYIMKKQHGLIGAIFVELLTCGLLSGCAHDRLKPTSNATSKPKSGTVVSPITAVILVPGTNGAPSSYREYIITNVPPTANQ